MESTYSKSELEAAYVKHLLRNGVPPVTVYRFCDDLGITEAEFYAHFGSFKVLEKKIWEQFFESTTSILKADENYSHYGVYEKWLSLLFTFIQELSEKRSLVVLRFEEHNYKEFNPWFLGHLKMKFNEHVKDLIDEGLSTEEIAKRPVITSKYNEALWFQLMYIIKVWVNDESEDFKTTDAAVEKSSALIFEMMKKGPIDLLIDFAKFAYQQKAW